jgi:hypothetical protein
MAIGNIPNQAQVNSQAAQLATQWRSAAEQSIAFNAYVSSLGTAGLIALGFASGDASNMITMSNYMLTMAQVFQGTATQSSDFNFQNALIAVTGPN